MSSVKNLPVDLGQTQVVMTPREIVHELDKYIVGQHDAKRSVAIALRNRWRRMQLKQNETWQDLWEEITPKNILMIGPTGVGKTEIARRLAKLANAPFIKVEATKFTEVGYVGRDVDSIIRDLVKVAIKMERDEALSKVEENAKIAAEDRILDELLPSAKKEDGEVKDNSKTREKFRAQLRKGELDDHEVETKFVSGGFGVEIMAPPGMEEMSDQLSGLFQSLANERKKVRKLRVKEAMKLLCEEEALKLINEDELKAKAIESVEQNGIVFIDELDKVARRSQKGTGADVSREGVQRDLLPLVEGTAVSTKFGTVRTDHILFIASGAFHVSKPSDLIPELQGRLPIRVELKALTTEDFVRILTEPKASLTEQYTALLKTEDVDIKFTQKGIKRVAQIAWQVNEQVENIGARRLYTVMERLLELISFEASDQPGQNFTIDEEYVDKQLKELMKNEDLSRYIL